MLMREVQPPLDSVSSVSLRLAPTCGRWRGRPPSTSEVRDTGTGSPTSRASQRPPGTGLTGILSPACPGRPAAGLAGPATHPLVRSRNTSSLGSRDFCIHPSREASTGPSTPAQAAALRDLGHPRRDLATRVLACFRPLRADEAKVRRAGRRPRRHLCNPTGAVRGGAGRVRAINGRGTWAPRRAGARSRPSAGARRPGS